MFTMEKTKEEIIAIINQTIEKDRKKLIFENGKYHILSLVSDMIVREDVDLNDEFLALSYVEIEKPTDEQTIAKLKTIINSNSINQKRYKEMRDRDES